MFDNDNLFYKKIGEENDIVILSTVRSNKNNVIGFVKDPNRTCVG